MKHVPRGQSPREVHPVIVLAALAAVVLAPVSTALAGAGGTAGGIDEAQTPLATDPILSSVVSAHDEATGGSPLERALHVADVVLDHRTRELQDLLPPELAHTADQEQRNLALSREVLGLTATGDGDLSLGVEAAKLATRWQAATAGTQWIDAPSIDEGSGPSQALASLAERHGVAFDAEDAAPLEELPEPLRTALAQVVLAFGLVDEAAAERVAGLDAPVLTETTADGQPMDRAMEAMASLDPSPVLSARLSFLDASLALTKALDATAPEVLNAVPPVDAPPAFSIRLAPNDDLHTDSVLLQIDGGGDDRYYNNAGGNGVFLLGLPLPPEDEPYQQIRKPPPSAAALDLGGGNDRYNVGIGRGGGAHGGAAGGGSGFLLDDGGDDLYHAGSGGSNGGGHAYGIGFLLEAGGNDTYTFPDRVSHSCCGANGGGHNYGMGLHIDVSGNDHYRTGTKAVNGGGRGGTGALIDLAGDDLYEGTSNGDNREGLAINGGAVQLHHPKASGVGFLLDASGDDEYVIRDAWNDRSGGVNGGAVISAVGFLFDADGTDVFDAGPAGTANGAAVGGWEEYGRYLPVSFSESGSYLAPARGFVLAAGGDDLFTGEVLVNGAGFGGGRGLLLTAGGNTTYLGTKVSNGGGGSGGEGLLVDLDGNDDYTGGQWGVNGGGFFGVGRLVDLSGDDTYTATSLGVNGGIYGSVNNAAIWVSTPSLPFIGRVGYFFRPAPPMGLLFDGGGHDLYLDSETDPAQQGSGEDRTVFPKGTLGAQIDTELWTGPAISSEVLS